MSLKSIYGSPDPDEERDIWSLVGPGGLPSAEDDAIAEREMASIGAGDYDDHQDQLDEAALQVINRIHELSDDDRDKVDEFIRRLLEDNLDP